jgi:hypothetical protein
MTHTIKNMNHQSLKISLAVFLGLLLLPSLSYAYPLISPNYQMQTGVIDNGGGENPSSTNFQIEADSIAQGGIIGESTSPSFTIQSGFTPGSTAEGEPNPPEPGAIPEFPTRIVTLLVGVLALGGYLWIRTLKKGKPKTAKG